MYKAVLDDYSWAYAASFFFQGFTRDDEKTPSNIYNYVDNPDRRVDLEVNQDYNTLIKPDANINLKPNSHPIKESVLDYDVERDNEYSVENYYEEGYRPSNE